MFKEKIKKYLNLYKIPEKFSLLLVPYFFPFRSIPKSWWCSAGTPLEALEFIFEKYLQVKQIRSFTFNGKMFDYLLCQFEFYNKYSYGFLHYWDPDYPVQWKSLFDPPLFVFSRGNRKLLNVKMFSVVGSRRASPVSVHFCRFYISRYREENLAVVSGFASGIDSIAHKTAIEEGIPTIAILGNGLNRLYPKENRKLSDLFKSTEQKNILVLSEYPFFTEPLAVNFPRRNRLIASLSSSLIVMESPVGGGSLITLDFVQGLNTEPYVFYHPLQFNNYGGYQVLKKSEANYLSACRKGFYVYHFDKLWGKLKKKNRISFFNLKSLLIKLIRENKVVSTGQDYYAFKGLEAVKEFYGRVRAF